MVPIQKPGRSKQDYQTPLEFLIAVRSKLWITDFAIDLAASAQNSVVSGCYYDEAVDSLKQTWQFGSWCWLNPPYADIRPWVEKAAHESALGARIAMLVPASVGANWWKDYVVNSSYQLFLNGRLTFAGCTTPYPKDCALLLYTPFIRSGNAVWEWRKDA